MSDSRIETRILYKSYENGNNKLDVLKGIDLRVKRNEFLAIQGPSGAGKSTLLHILGGLDYPSSGEVFTDGQSLFALSDDRRAALRNKKIGFVFQFYHLLPELNALENVMLPSILKSWRLRKQSSYYARQLLKELGLSERIYHRPAQLSGGEQQRVALARALMNKPEILLCDEPTGNLDSENGQNILKLIKHMNTQEHTTVILVTHDKDIARVADRIIYLKDGIILN